MKTLSFCAALLLATCAIAGDADADAVETSAKFLTAYVEGGKTIPPTPGFADHDGARREMDLNRAAFRLQQAASPERLTAVAAPLLALLEADDERGVRALQVLARLQVRDALPAILQRAESPGAAQLTAINALGLFGAEPRDIGYVTTVNKRVVFPPAPDELATAALLRLLARQPAEGANPKERKAVLSLRREALGALRTHTGEAVEAAVAETLNDESLRAEALWLFLSSRLAAPVATLAALSKHKRPDVRNSAARALGLSGQKEAVAPLLGLLGDKLFFVKEAANEGLCNLQGAAPKTCPSKGSRAVWSKRFGPGLSAFDAARARRYTPPPVGER